VGDNIVKTVCFLVCFVLVLVGIVLLFNFHQTSYELGKEARILMGSCYIVLGILILLFIEK